MSLTFNLELSPRDNKEGFRKIMIRVTLDRVHIERIDTEILIEKKHWNQKAKFGQWVRKTHDMHLQINEQLKNQLNERRLSKLINKDSTVAEYIKTYTERLRKGHAFGYVRNQQYSLGRFARFLKPGIKLSEVTTAMVNRYKEHLQGNNHKVLYIRESIKNVQTMFESALSDNVVKDNPVTQVKLPTEKERRRKRLTTDQMSEVKPEKVSIPAKTGKRHENIAYWKQLSLKMFLFSYYCSGVRVADTIEMRVSSVSGDRVEYQMNKQGKYMSMPKHAHVRELLEEFITPDKKPTDYLFPVLDNSYPFAYALTREEKYGLSDDLAAMRFMKIKSATSLLNKYLALAMYDLGFKEKITFHVSRHSFGDKLRRLLKTNGAVTLDPARLSLGHGDLRTTQIYFDSLDYQGQDEALAEVWGDSK